MRTDRAAAGLLCFHAAPLCPGVTPVGRWPRGPKRTGAALSQLRPPCIPGRVPPHNQVCQLHVRVMLPVHAAKRNKKMKKTEKKMAAFMEQANQRLEGSGFGLKAVFVTFDKESQAEACLAASPKGVLPGLLHTNRVCLSAVPGLLHKARTVHHW